MTSKLASPEPPETAELLAFTKTIEARSLSRAAAELAVPRATIGRRLARLEEKLGVRLLRRTTRALALTDAGESFYRHARIVLDAVAQAESSVRQDGRLRGTVRIAIPPLLDKSFNALVVEFSRQNPEVTLHVNASARHVDLLREGYDLALRAATSLDDGLVARTLLRAPTVAAASPAYLRERGTPRTLGDLRRHACLLGFARGEVPQTHWPRRGGGRVAVQGTFFSNDLLLLADASVRGLGIALLPTLLVGGLLESGQLVRVLDDAIEAEDRIAIVYPERELQPPQVRAFMDALVSWAPEGLGAVRRFVAACTETEERTVPRGRTKGRARRPGHRAAGIETGP